MISIEAYLQGRDKLFPDEYTEEIRLNAIETVDKVNRLLAIWGGYTHVSSGWRPQAVNKNTVGAKKKSNHLLARACDLSDKSGALDTWCMANLKVLEDIGLWMEHPSATESPERFGHGWTHLQIVPPKSGRRVFYP